MTITKIRFVVAVQKFVHGNMDKVQALWGILDSNRYGIDRKVRAIADILGIGTEDIPSEIGRHCGLCAAATVRAIASHLAIATRKDWRKFTAEAEWIRIRREQLRDRERREKLSLRERLEHRKVFGDHYEHLAPVKFIWEQLQFAKKELAQIAS